jgi:predicted AAA+ superfamily ATPase
MGLILRGVEAELRDILSVSRAAAITGPRQAGKSTLAMQLQRAGILPNYYSLDDEPLRLAARSDPDGFAQSLPRPAVIDEIQRAPELMLAVSRSSTAILRPASSCSPAQPISLRHA